MKTAPARLPDTSGVYFFKQGKKILYIGKATSLRDRVRSYFNTDILRTRGPWITRMLDEVTDVAYEQTDSVLEALILEAALIKKHQPPYNTREKSNKSFNYVIITNEEYPRVYTIRERELLTDKTPCLALYGPFPHGGQLRDALRLVRKIFPYRGKTDSPLKNNKRRISRIYEEIGLAPNASSLLFAREEYRRTIRHLRLFFEGRKKELLKSLEKDMKTYAKQQAFEKAQELKRQIFALQHINDVALIRNISADDSQGCRIESYDIAHMSGEHRVGVMTVVENGEAQTREYRMFKIRKDDSYGDTGALREVLERRLDHTEWHFPKIIVVDGGIAQKNTAEKILLEFGFSIPVIAVVKNEYHKPQRVLGPQHIIKRYESDILLANSESHRFAINFHRKIRKIS